MGIDVSSPFLGSATTMSDLVLGAVRGLGDARADSASSASASSARTAACSFGADDFQELASCLPSVSERERASQVGPTGAATGVAAVAEADRARPALLAALQHDGANGDLSPSAAARPQKSRQQGRQQTHSQAWLRPRKVSDDDAVSCLGGSSSSCHTVAARPVGLHRIDRPPERWRASQDRRDAVVKAASTWQRHQGSFCADAPRAPGDRRVRLDVARVARSR